jgi:hypothetical protein
MDQNDQVRDRAHQIWEAEGRPEGKDADHWARAQRELQVEGAAGEDASKSDTAVGSLSTSESDAPLEDGIKAGGGRVAVG